MVYGVPVLKDIRILVCFVLSGFTALPSSSPRKTALLIRRSLETFFLSIFYQGSEQSE